MLSTAISIVCNVDCSYFWARPSADFWYAVTPITIINATGTRNPPKILTPIPIRSPLFFFPLLFFCGVAAFTGFFILFIIPPFTAPGNFCLSEQCFYFIKYFAKYIKCILIYVKIVIKMRYFCPLKCNFFIRNNICSIILLI